VTDVPADRTEEVAAAVLAHPAVARLDGGPFGTVASYLPGRRRVLGVRIGVGDEPVELAVVVRLGTPLPQLADELGDVVRGLLGPVPVEVTFSDVVLDPAGPLERSGGI
jgi:anti-sigma factor RsiW